MAPWRFGAVRVEAELLPSLLELRAYRDTTGLPSGLLEAGTANMQQRAQG